MKLLGFFLSMVTGSEYICQFLGKYTDCIFTYPGGANLHLLDVLSKDPTKRLLVNRHEQFVGHSAEGYAKAGQRLGVAITTSGPGITNMITPLQDAMSDGIPLLCISAQVSNTSLYTHAFQEVDAIGLTKSCTKWNALVRRGSELIEVLDKAIFYIYEKRTGPVHIDICSNVFSEMMEVKEVKSKGRFLQRYRGGDRWKCMQVSRKVNEAKSPIIIVGKGAVKVYKEIRWISERFQIPVATTLHGLGIMDEESDLSLKMVGMHGTAYANKAIQMADLILGIGYRFDDRTIGNPVKYALKAKQNRGILHVDHSRESLEIAKRVVPTDISLEMDSESFVHHLCRELKGSNRTDWIHQILDLKNTWKLDYKENNRLKVPDIIRELSYQLRGRDDYKITTGVGNHQMMVAQYFTWRSPNKMMTSGSLGTMGVGLPFLIGSQMAYPKDMMICIDGDGSFMMSLQELSTIREYNLPVKILLMNDESLQMVTSWQDLFYGQNRVGTKLKNPQFPMLGRSFGIKSIQCDSKYNLRSIIKYLLNYPRAILCEFRVEADQLCTPFVLPGNALDDMLL